jgi:hypothetical protein
LMPLERPRPCGTRRPPRCVSQTPGPFANQRVIARRALCMKQHVKVFAIMGAGGTLQVLAEHCRAVAEHCRVLAERCRVLAERCRVLAERCRVLAERCWF